MQNLDIDLDKVKYLREFYTNNELNLIKNFNIDKLKKYYETALARYDWDFINKEKIIKHCKKRFYYGI